MSEILASRVVVRSIVLELVHPRNEWWDRDRDTGDLLQWENKPLPHNSKPWVPR